MPTASKDAPVRSMCCIAILLSAALAAAGDVRVETIDAGPVAGELTAIDANSVTVRTEKGPRKLDRAGVLDIRLRDVPDPMAARRGRPVVRLAGGDALALRDLAVAGGKLVADSPVFGRVTIGLDAVSVIYLPPVEQSAAELEAAYRDRNLPAAAGDRLVVARPGKGMLPVDGVVQAIGPKRVTIRWRDRPRQVARDSVRIIRLAEVGGRETTRKGSLVGRDGSRAGFTRLLYADGLFVMTSPAFGERKVKASRVAAVRLASEDIVELSSLEPAAVKEQGFFAATFAHRRNLSVGGKPLRLSGRTYRTGLGLHSMCELLYQLDGEYSKFVATVGIDDAVRPHGDATVTFLADGRPVGKPLRVTGTSEPEQVRLNLDGVKVFLIRVDFGEDGLGFSDHVDLAAARLIR